MKLPNNFPYLRPRFAYLVFLFVFFPKNVLFLYQLLLTLSSLVHICSETFSFWAFSASFHCRIPWKSIYWVFVVRFRANGLNVFPQFLTKLVLTWKYLHCYSKIFHNLIIEVEKCFSSKITVVDSIFQTN